MQFYRYIKLDILGKIRNPESRYDELEELNLGFMEGIFLNMSNMSQDLGGYDILTIFDHLGGEIQVLGNLILDNEQIYSDVVGRNQ